MGVLLRQAPDEIADVVEDLTCRASQPFLLGLVDTATPSTLIERIHRDALLRQCWEEDAIEVAVIGETMHRY